MIKLDKSISVPSVLSNKGVSEYQRLCLRFEMDPASFQGSQSHPPSKRIRFKPSIYNHPTVKQQLIEDQHGKCAFCESKVLAISFGDVEHYRPKGAWRQSNGDEMRYPGYFWLAYEWENLLLACTKCNQAFKKDHFPLLYPRSRFSLTCRDDSVLVEQPAVIDPYTMCPIDFLTFHHETILGTDPDGIGETTIDRCGLNRKELMDDRRRLLDLIEPHLVWLDFDEKDPQSMALAEKVLQKTAAEIHKVVQQARSILAKVVLQDAPYAAMVRANFPKLIR